MKFPTLKTVADILAIAMFAFLFPGMGTSIDYWFGSVHQNASVMTALVSEPGIAGEVSEMAPTHPAQGGMSLKDEPYDSDAVWMNSFPNK